MASFSSLTVMGNITQDLEVRAIGAGTNVLDISIAVNTYEKGAENNQVTTFLRGSIFGQKAEVIAKNFKKGDPIVLIGQDLKLRSYEKKDGTQGSSLEFRINDFSFVGSKGGGDNSYTPAVASTKDEAVTEVPEGEVDLSEIPF